VKARHDGPIGTVLDHRPVDIHGNVPPSEAYAKNQEANYDERQPNFIANARHRQSRAAGYS
jgi:hypothetical protein